MRALGRLIFQQFDDPRVEARYRLEQRQRQLKFTRAMVWITLGLYLWYFSVNWLFVEPRVVFAVAVGHFSMVPVIFAYAWYVGRSSYPANRWADVAVMIAVQPSSYLSVSALSAAGVTGWPFYTEFAYILAVELAFASIAVAASVRTFALIAALAVVYYPTLLALMGHPLPLVFYSGSFFATLTVVLVYMNWAIDDKARALFAAGVTIAAEREKSDNLLDNILPRAVADRLRSGQAVADEYPEVAIVFVDVVGFTTLAKQLPARRTVELLNAFFAHADRGVDLFGLDKVKTIGDAYMAVSGAMTRPPRPAKAALDFACYLIEGAKDLSRRFEVDFRLHVGINTGPVIGGVISAKRISYDYWGDTINLASRLQDVAGANGVAVSAATFEQVRDAYAFADPRKVPLKGMGEVDVYDLRIGEFG
ncbi:MAG: adenylate/guanylate cyclase domain-containing protein [Novosphingobium sp.]|nr:adenylate/guanylate cyclase domain-containing protein [Novosphingobium sp.]